MFRKFPLYLTLFILSVSSTVTFGQQAQQETQSLASTAALIPHVIRYTGTADATPGETLTLKFALYENQTGGDAVWTESQQVTPDTAGKYSVLLGAATENGLPQNAFSSAQARWLGITVGDGQESARTILVATPYSLKASDSETLSGHPVSDFKLKSALPAGGTDITQIDGTDGVVVNGSGTGPTVTLGLSNSYLQGLGNEIYSQLSGNNTLTGNNAFGAGKVTLGGSPALSVANVTAASPVTVTASTTGVKIGLSDSALLTLGNGVYAQLAAANTFTKPITFASGQSFPGTVSLSGTNTFTGSNTFSKAISFASGQTFPGTVSLSGTNTFTGSNTFSKAITFASGQTFPGTGTITGITTTSPLSGSGTSGSVALSLNTSALETTLNAAYAGLSATNTFTSSNKFNGGIQATAPTTAVYGHDTDMNQSDAAAGVYGVTDNLNSASAGVYGLASAGGSAAGVAGIAISRSNEGATYEQFLGSPGVWGDSNLGVGVLGTSDDNYAAYFANNNASGSDTVYIRNDDTSGNAGALIIGNEGSDTFCEVDYNSTMYCGGGFTSQFFKTVAKVDGRDIASYGMQSAENWSEDFGTAQLASGAAHVTLDPRFAATVNTSVDYHVFLTPRGDSEGLYVTNQSPESFDVRESKSGKSSIAFDYRIVAKRKGLESARLEDLTAGIEKARVRVRKGAGSVVPSRRSVQHPPIASLDMNRMPTPVRSAELAPHPAK